MQHHINKTASSALWLFTSLFLATMFLPRLVPQGMFGDGLLYASLARNLAEGRGSFWAPFFSSGYWIDFASGNPYFENPPLMIWLQAGFFWLLGDVWWVEKLYALLLFLLNAWLIVSLWEIPLRGTAYQKKYGWLPLFFWYLIPSAIWGNPNNLMDNNLLTFCLLALWCALDGLFSQKKMWLKMSLAGVCVWLGFMTKGPVALYPAAVPFLFAVAVPVSSSTMNFRSSIAQSVWIGLVAAGIFAVMLAFIPESRIYFENYWEGRLGVVISGEREDAALTGWARLSIFVILAKELIVVAAVVLIVFFISRRGKNRGATTAPNVHPFRTPQKIALLFLLLGGAATLPLMASARQSGMYIIPGLPMFALAAGCFCLPLLHSVVESQSESTSKFFRNLRAFSFIGSIALVIHLFFLFGKPGREKYILDDLPAIQRLIPKAEKVAVCDDLMGNLHTHTYMQRFHHLELSRDFARCAFAMTNQQCDSDIKDVLRQHGFERTQHDTFQTSSHIIYVARR